MRRSKLTEPVGCKYPQTFSSAACILFWVKKHRKTNLHNVFPQAISCPEVQKLMTKILPYQPILQKYKGERTHEYHLLQYQHYVGFGSSDMPPEFSSECVCQYAPTQLYTTRSSEVIESSPDSSRKRTKPYIIRCKTLCPYVHCTFLHCLYLYSPPPPF